jgi:putative ABC transport system ATP-binding protein
MTEPVLKLEEVTKIHAGPPPVEALRGIDLEVSAGDLVAVVGPSGSGKSTLLNLMGTLDRPSSGQVFVEGQAVGLLGDRRLAGLRAHRIGFVFQEYFLIPGMTVWENVAQGLVYRGIRSRLRRRVAADTLERVGLSERIEHLPSRLSGGERQRVAIARALVGQPAVVLADEPTGNLDSETSASILDLFVELNRQGSTFVVITHDRELAARLPRRFSIRDGRLV